ALIDDAFDQDRTDGFALLVAQHDRGADEVGAGGAAGLVAVAEGAVGRVKLFASGGGSGVGSGAEAEEVARVAAAAASARRNLLLREDRAEEGEQKERGPGGPRRLA